MNIREELIKFEESKHSLLDENSRHTYAVKIVDNYLMNNVSESKIEKLSELTSNKIFVEYYPHTDKEMYKILNEYTEYNSEKFVLCGVDESYNTALDLAIELISDAKSKAS